MKSQYIRTDNWAKITDEFIENTFKAFHYSIEQKQTYIDTAWAVRGCIKDQEAAELIYEDSYIEVAFSLGERLDVLIDNYSKKGKLLEALMATNIASAVLMNGYKLLEVYAQEYFKSKATRMVFWGTNGLLIEDMPGSIDKFSNIKIRCNESMNLIPSQSVCFRMYPSCTHENLCDNCELKSQGKCNNTLMC